MRLILLILLSLSLGSIAWAEPREPISDKNAIRAILGEARGEGYAGMYAVACAIRNRGSLKGVYGLKASMPDLTPKVAQEAKKAWFNSLSGPDVTLGASFWEGTRFKKPYWAKKMVETVTIGHQRFYREVSHERG